MITQQELAKILGVSQMTVSAILRGGALAEKYRPIATAGRSRCAFFRSESRGFCGVLPEHWVAASRAACPDGG